MAPEKIGGFSFSYRNASIIVAQVHKHVISTAKVL